MRLDQRTRDEIRATARRFFGADAYLFGSRADDTRRGGDIDLYLESARSAEEAVRARLAMLNLAIAMIGQMDTTLQRMRNETK